MSACNPLFLGLAEELGYVQCSFCTTILLVSVPRDRLLKTVVTVECGHCTALLSVTMVRASFLPLQLLSSLQVEADDHETCNLTEEKQESVRGDTAGITTLEKRDEQGDEQEDEEEEEEEEEEECTPASTGVNKPPEKRQRAPTAYNRFIKEEIKRIKAREPSITHKEAFSTAAKRWAQCPRISHPRGDGESCSCGRQQKVALPIADPQRQCQCHSHWMRI